VPAAIRAVIEEKEKDRAVVFAPSFHGLSCIEGYGSSRIEEIALALDGLNPLSREYDAFTATMLAQIRVVPFDSEGRIVLGTMEQKQPLDLSLFPR
jgi:DNA-binding transcriptional regulator/RsmH inhibitor MraZ